MDVVRYALLALHIGSLVVLLVTLLATLGKPSRTVTQAMVWSARLVFLAGILLVGVREMGDLDVNHAKVGVKLVVALAVVGLIEANQKRPVFANPPYFVALGLTILNIAVATLW